jgi:hypothetical protein
LGVYILPPLTWISSSKFKRFHTPYLVVQINWGTFSSSQPPSPKFPLLCEHFVIRFWRWGSFCSVAPSLPDLVSL